jgi:hypothetical protein
MWDCKTSKMSPIPACRAQRLRLIRGGAPGRARPHTFEEWRPPLFRGRSPLRFRAASLKSVQNGGPDNGTGLDGVLWSLSFTPRLRAGRRADRLEARSRVGGQGANRGGRRGTSRRREEAEEAAQASEEEAKEVRQMKPLPWRGAVQAAEEVRSLPRAARTPPSLKPRLAPC